MQNDLSVKKEIIVQLLKKNFKSNQATMFLQSLRMSDELIEKTEFVIAGTVIQRTKKVATAGITEKGDSLREGFFVEYGNMVSFNAFASWSLAIRCDKLFISLDLNDKYFLDDYLPSEVELPIPLQNLVNGIIGDSVLYGIKTLIDQALISGNKERFIWLTNHLKEYENDIYLPF